MHHAIAVLTLAIAAPAALSAPHHEHAPDEPVTTIGFAACYEPAREAPITDVIAAADHDLFVFLGDNVYADTRDERDLRQKWARLTDRPWFQELRRRSHVLATWDDHDFGENDAGRTYPLREASQRAFLDAFDEPAGSARRTSEGVYDACVFGPQGRRVQVVLLDTRYFRDDLTLRETPDRAYADGSSGAYLPNDDPALTMLGDAQWAWLEATLREPAELRVIVSSVQALTTDHGWESWALFPRERERLLGLLAGAGPTVIVSGDRHKTEVSRTREADGCEGVRELTVGSLNKPIPWFNEINERRVGSIYFGPAYGVVAIEWGTGGPVVRLETRREDGVVVMTHDVTWMRQPRAAGRSRAVGGYRGAWGP